MDLTADTTIEQILLQYGRLEKIAENQRLRADHSFSQHTATLKVALDAIEFVKTPAHRHELLDSLTKILEEKFEIV